MKSSIAKCIILAILFIINISLAGTYSGGNGDTNEPYEISSLSDWQQLMTTPDDWSKCFILMADLDWDGLSITPIGNATTRFTGNFDGNKHIISNAVINQPGSNYVGLFGHTVNYQNNGQICNLGVENINVTGDSNVGGLVGYFDRYNISNCYVTGTINGNERIGGLIGYNGGFGLTASCYTACTVNGNNYVGGLIGRVSTPGGTILNCYTACTITGNTNVGGFTGENLAGFIKGCFWDMQTSGQISGGTSVGLNTTAMQDVETYLREFWDFKGEIKNGTNDTWAMPIDGGYPVFAWQINDSPINNDEMTNSIAITTNTAVSGTTIDATGLDLTSNGYKDMVDAWYHFNCNETGKYTITLQPENFDSTVAIFDENQEEIAFNDDFFGNKSVVILKAIAGWRYYIRVSGCNCQMGNFTLTIDKGSIQAIQGDLNYDGMVDLVDFAIFAGQWLEKM